MKTLFLALLLAASLGTPFLNLAFICAVVCWAFRSAHDADLRRMLDDY
jgi:hypothetical protein